MPSISQSDPINRDVEAIGRISAVPTILRVIAETTGLRFCAVARVTQDQWVACAVHDHLGFGLAPGGTLDVATTLCAEVRDTRATVVMDHASTDSKYCNHQTPKLYGFESYISVPIFLVNGDYFGTVCALDPLPTPVNQPKIVSMMTLFAELIGAQLAAEQRQTETQEQLLDVQQTAEIREQFIAVLGHDLRNPLSSVTMGADLLLRQSLPEPQRKTVERIRSSGRRMSALVSDLLDFARARLGAGIGLNVGEVRDLELALRHVVDELQSTHPAREIRFTSDMAGPIWCDKERVCQLLSNLVANAIEHGAAERPVEVRVRQSKKVLQISVQNAGEPIAAETMGRLFRPYSRGGQDQGSLQGLGLGLYIASEIAQAHAGRLDVSSDAVDGTRFTFTLPIQSR